MTTPLILLWGGSGGLATVVFHRHFRRLNGFPPPPWLELFVAVGGIILGPFALVGFLIAGLVVR